MYKNLNIETDNLPGGKFKKLLNVFQYIFGGELKKLFALFVSGVYKDINIETDNLPGSELKKLWNVVENGEKADRENVV